MLCGVLDYDPLSIVKFLPTAGHHERGEAVRATSTECVCTSLGLVPKVMRKNSLPRVKLAWAQPTKAPESGSRRRQAFCS